MEDILTSNVFSFFKYSEREVFLNQFLYSIGIIVKDEELESAEFRFWIKYDDRTEPDLVILVGRYYLLIEAKYFSDFGRETDKTEAQLIRELKGGFYEAENLDLDFRIITVTADYYKKVEKYDQIPIEFQDKIIWTSWQKICLLIEHILAEESVISSGNRLFAADLYLLLLKKNLVEFSGMKRLSSLPPCEFTKEDVFFKSSTANYRGDFIGFIEALLDTNNSVNVPGTIFFSNTKEDYFNFDININMFKEVCSNQIFYNCGGVSNER
jgi:hypothetical protein